jgi:RNA polymerase sigma-70 factor (ECF subfamily)
MSAKTLREIPESELVERIAKGEKDLFEIIIRHYNQRMYRIGMSILNDGQEAEDAMQTAYISAYENLSKFEGRSSFGTWLTRIMLNQCYSQLRKKRNPTLDVDLLDGITSMKTPANILMNKELNQALEDAVSMLPEKYRLVFVLREIEGLSVHETADSLNLEDSNVKVRLNRAKVMLRENLTQYMKGSIYDFHLSRCDRIASKVMDYLKNKAAN